ncbi:MULTISPECIES: AMP-binding protein [Nostoc]|uniref:AMP-binding protein n=2 Tax=Nostoc TaxID=1177 RepID=A0ABR8IHD4_9NOSO|nr:MULTISPECIES: AMP-binding protein [Nostoc]MBD2565337.1 AMP-binding protein [Nostoc linckia FACHB-391]MBD2651009.1 AMP-binding protein [Nostoc foliaceum FACHB-393]
MLVSSKNNLNQIANLVDLLRYRQENQANEIAFTFLSNGETEQVNLTYQELDIKARSIATTLQSQEAIGERALLLYQPGLEFITAFFGCLYAGVIAVPAYPPRRNHHNHRLQAIVADAQATIVLTTKSVFSDIEKTLKKELPGTKLNYITTDDINISLANDWQSPQLDRDTLAFIQYTSGSTGMPKGVMVSHGNLLHNLSLIHKCFEHEPKSQGVIWLPPYHDMGLIGGVLQPIYGGFPVILMPPVAFLQKPIRWLQAISDSKATTSGGPNFAYELCVQKIKPEQIAGLDLNSWKVAFTGAEPIRVKTLERFAKTFADCGFRMEAFYPCYGMAETTLFVSGGLTSESPIVRLVDGRELSQNRVADAVEDSANAQAITSCGCNWLDQKIVIAHPETKTTCADGEVGEIWVSGESVALGYWRKPEQTQQTFHAYLVDTGEGPFLRTGDLGFLQDGELYVTGRIKDVIIIRGRNYYPQDIELTVENSHPALHSSCCAAFSIEVKEQEQLVIAVEVERAYLRNLDVDGIASSIRKAVSEQHELQVYAVAFLKPSSIPKTSSGKIQRHACRSGFLEDSLNTVGLWKSEVIESVKSPTKMQPAESKHIHPSTTSVKNSSHNSVNVEDKSKSCANDLIGWLRSYASERINSRLIDERRCIPPYIVLDFGNHGLLGMQVPKQYGGMALNYQDTLRVIEQLAAIDLTLASFVGVHHVLGTRPIMNWASKTVQEELLPLIAQGRELAGFAITEPGAGSNPRAIATTAIPDNKGGWRINGQKSWIGHGSWAGTINVFVQLLDANHQLMGMSGFVVRQGTKGIRQGPEALTMGMRGMVQNTIYFEDVSVNPQYLLGEAGNGMKVAQDAMMFGRLGLGAMSLGGMKRCAQLMLRYSERRFISTGRLLDNPTTLVRLSDLTAAITALETLIFAIAKLLDLGYSVPEEAYTACKTSGPEFFWQASDHLVQLLGARGYIETNIAPQILRDARLLRIFEGPTETLNSFLGSRIINKSQELQKFLCEGLGTPEIAQRLKIAADQINDHLTNHRNYFSEHHTAVHWAYIRTGELTTFAILLAAVQGASKVHVSEKLIRAKNWAEFQFEQKFQSIISGIAGEVVVSDTNALTTQISDYVTSIGDIEQTLAGEDNELDELLRRNLPKNKSEIESRISLELTENQESIQSVENNQAQFIEVNDDHSTESIQTWIENWLAQKLKIDVMSIVPTASFSDYGMDSVMAVDAAQDLSEWLQLSLEPTILWNYPTIASLAQYLAKEVKVKTADTPKTTELQIKVEQNPSSPLFGSLENEIEQSIAQELEVLENLLRG